MRANERCQHPDCVYRNHADPEVIGNCHFWMITGRSRIAGLKGKEQLPCNCPHYQPDGTDPRESAKDWRTIALALYMAGEPDRVICEKTGRCRDTIRRWRGGLGLALNPDRQGPETKFDWKTAEKLYRQGKNDGQIAAALGCGASSVRRWRWKYELLPNERKPRKEREAT